MKILALDTATRKCGYALLDDGKLVDSGVWVMKGNDLNDRLAQLLVFVQEACLTGLPDMVALEVPFVHAMKRKDTGLKLGQAVGVVKGWAFSHGIGVMDVYPSQAKRAAAGHRGAAKSAVQETVKARFGLADVQADEADAIAVGIFALSKLSNDLTNS